MLIDSLYPFISDRLRSTHAACRFEFHHSLTTAACPKAPCARNFGTPFPAVRGHFYPVTHGRLRPVVTTIDYNKVQQVMQKEPSLLSVYVGILENTLQEKLLRENALLSMCATERYLDLKRRIPGIEERVSQIHIASYIGITPVSLSRIRRTLREENG